MLVFDVSAMPFPPPPKPSMFTTLMNTYKAQASAIVRFLSTITATTLPAPAGHDEDDEHILGCVLGAPPRGSHHQNGDKRQRLHPTKTKHKRVKYPRMNQKDSLWWKMFFDSSKVQ